MADVDENAGASESSNVPESNDVGGSGDADAGAEPTEFCAALERLDALELENDPTPFVDGMRDIDDAAPDEISDATAQLLEFVEAGLAIGALEGEERETAIGELAGSEGDFDAAVAEMQAYAVDACPGLGDSLLGTTPDSVE